MAGELITDPIVYCKNTTTLTHFVAHLSQGLSKLPGAVWLVSGLEVREETCNHSAGGAQIDRCRLRSIGMGSSQGCNCGPDDDLSPEHAICYRGHEPVLYCAREVL